ncbi:L,D-transpeptidase [Kibdelosporangium persicum]|uniref:Lipoprotein-anchoring transpeptidase ErfK/SrfK n=2 Tax=Kibdelosporangium persicum TaxID=2698649 RepID=A0ABX2F8V6_9PSEU|nr:Lipoprotein-anchoring transpeptidase ErfK/SrfK [Kibdelosporangium persicum]
MRLRKLIVGAAVAATAVLGACSSPTEQPVGLAAGQQSVPVTTTETTTTAPSTTTPTSSPETTTSTRTSTRTTTPKPPTTTKTTPKATTPKPQPSAEAPCSTAAKACIKLSTNQSWLMDNGKVVYGPVPITHGRKGYATPPGSFKVTFKNKNHRSSIFNNAPMPYSVFFNGGIAFHQGSLREKSHGCIHLSMAAAQKYFGALSVGDVVEVVR